MTQSFGIEPEKRRLTSTSSHQSTAVKLMALLLVLVAGALVVAVIRIRELTNTVTTALAGSSATEPRPVAPAPENLGASEQSVINVFREVSAGVVNVTTLAVRRNRFSMDVSEIPAGTGSGFVWDTAGHVVTNFHVVASADRALVTLQDGHTYAAKVVGQAPDKDIAVLKIDAPPSKLRPIPVGTSTDLLVGQSVLAIGNPFGFDQTLTTGVISGLGREIKSLTQRPITDMIQTDASINPGNSGGPLLDSSGRLIGINTSIYSPTGSSAGIGFAVPADTVNAIVAQLIKHGRVIRPGLGIQLGADQHAAQLGVEGVLVFATQPGGPADRAGIVGVTVGENGRAIVNDFIVSLNGNPVRLVADLYRALDQHKPTEVVKVGVRRAGVVRDVDVTLGELP